MTFVALATADGEAFEYWYVVLPTQTEQVMSAQVTLYLPAGYTSSNSLIEAFYG